MKDQSSTGRKRGAFVELRTAQQKVFSGPVEAVKFSPVNAVIEIQPGGLCYFAQVVFGELALRIGKRFHFFAVIRAAACMRQQHLTIIAERIERLPSTGRNCGNPLCNCGHEIVQPDRRCSADCDICGPPSGKKGQAKRRRRKGGQ